ncbi:endonuclease domain-containing protein [Roseibium sediminis]|uniref:endonuclease domain-containing protein n=1 Tax=Roseibium sediminis TaxID=1775174 RepID=UPI00123D6004|nr:endonuclease domain-containing protein [Roseibium sediminis]
MSPTRITGKTRQTAKQLRREQSYPEKLLWRQLRELKTKGVHIRRQAPIGPYVADFVAFSRKVVIEVDGDFHGLDDVRLRDEQRDKWLAGEGFEVWRFPAVDVIGNLEGVMEVILKRFGVWD